MSELSAEAAGGFLPSVNGPVEDVDGEAVAEDEELMQGEPAQPHIEAKARRA